LAALVDFHLRDPAGKGRTLLDVLTEAADGAERGGGIFAFASKTGIDMLLEANELRTLVAVLGFDLVVGVDSITDTRALDRLVELSQRRSALRARVLVHDSGGLFHPKICWFADGSNLRLVVGSGNLTLGGLARNTEAFVATTLVGDAASTAEGEVQGWLKRWEPWLLAPDAVESRARAAKNSGSEGSFREKMKRRDEEPRDEDVPPVTGEAEVLVLDVSKNVSRGRTQLEVGKEKLRTYFGGDPGKTRRILIQSVDPQGVLGELEPPRRLVRAKSRNFRIELGAGHARDYPASGKPIAIFARCEDGIFRYQLFWPGEPGHAEVDRFLTKLAGRTMGGNMRRETGTVAQLREAWPDSPLLVAIGALG
jgi:hypothetical protein